MAAAAAAAAISPSPSSPSPPLGLRSPVLLAPLAVCPLLLPRRVRSSSRRARKAHMHMHALLTPPDLSPLSSCALLAGILPVDPWSPNVDSQSVASQLFAVSLFPYLGFLYCITQSKTAPKLTLFGFYFLLVFVAATIPAGIYAKVHYRTSLSNVDWLHGGAESFLTLTNLFIVLGLRNALRDASSGGDSANLKNLQTAEEENLPSQKTSLIAVSLEDSKVVEENDKEGA